eukprot:Rhum_TRINITY_DN14647_c7_g2::Rhum_TRINITY_DN14647_c7_g2_i1::g.107037::m.107037
MPPASDPARRYVDVCATAGVDPRVSVVVALRAAAGGDPASASGILDLPRAQPTPLSDKDVEAVAEALCWPSGGEETRGGTPLRSASARSHASTASTVASGSYASAPAAAALHLEQINLQGNALTWKAARALSVLVHDCRHTLAAIRLGENSLEDVGCEVVCSTFFQVRGGDEGSVGGADQGAASPGSGGGGSGEPELRCTRPCALQLLDLRANRLTSLACLPLSTLLGSPHVLPHVHTLLLQKNAVDDAGCMYLAEGMRRGRTLRRLSLRFNRVGDAGAAALIENLPASLTDLDLGGNAVGVEGGRLVADALACGDGNLRKVNLRSNRLGDAGVAAFAAAVASNPAAAPVELFLGYNAFSEEAAVRLLDAVAPDAPLLRLDIQGPPLSPAGLDALAAALARHTRACLDHVLLDAAAGAGFAAAAWRLARAAAAAGSPRDISVGGPAADAPEAAPALALLRAVARLNRALHDTAGQAAGLAAVPLAAARFGAAEAAAAEAADGGGGEPTAEALETLAAGVAADAAALEALPRRALEAEEGGASDTADPRPSPPPEAAAAVAAAAAAAIHAESPLHEPAPPPVLSPTVVDATIATATSAAAAAVADADPAARGILAELARIRDELPDAGRAAAQDAQDAAEEEKVGAAVRRLELEVKTVYDRYRQHFGTPNAVGLKAAAAAGAAAAAAEGRAGSGSVDTALDLVVRGLERNVGEFVAESLTDAGTGTVTDDESTYVIDYTAGFGFGHHSAVSDGAATAVRGDLQSSLLTLPPDTPERQQDAAAAAANEEAAAATAAAAAAAAEGAADATASSVAMDAEESAFELTADSSDCPPYPQPRTGEYTRDTGGGGAMWPVDGGEDMGGDEIVGKGLQSLQGGARNVHIGHLSTASAVKRAWVSSSHEATTPASPTPSAASAATAVRTVMAGLTDAASGRASTAATPQQLRTPLVGHADPRTPSPERPSPAVLAAPGGGGAATTPLRTPASEEPQPPPPSSSGRGSEALRSVAAASSSRGAGGEQVPTAIMELIAKKQVGKLEGVVKSQMSDMADLVEGLQGQLEAISASTSGTDTRLEDIVRVLSHSLDVKAGEALREKIEEVGSAYASVSSSVNQILPAVSEMQQAQRAGVGTRQQSEEHQQLVGRVSDLEKTLNEIAKGVRSSLSNFEGDVRRLSEEQETIGTTAAQALRHLQSEVDGLRARSDGADDDTSEIVKRVQAVEAEVSGLQQAHSAQRVKLDSLAARLDEVQGDRSGERAAAAAADAAVRAVSGRVEAVEAAVTAVAAVAGDTTREKQAAEVERSLAALARRVESLESGAATAAASGAAASAEWKRPVEELQRRAEASAAESRKALQSTEKLTQNVNTITADWCEGLATLKPKIEELFAASGSAKSVASKVKTLEADMRQQATVVSDSLTRVEGRLQAGLTEASEAASAAAAAAAASAASAAAAKEAPAAGGAAAPAPAAYEGHLQTIIGQQEAILTKVEGMSARIQEHDAGIKELAEIVQRSSSSSQQQHDTQPHPVPQQAQAAQPLPAQVEKLLAQLGGLGAAELLQHQQQQQ